MSYSSKDAIIIESIVGAVLRFTFVGAYTMSFVLTTTVSSGIVSSGVAVSGKVSCKNGNVVDGSCSIIGSSFIVVSSVGSSFGVVIDGFCNGVLVNLNPSAPPANPAANNPVAIARATILSLFFFFIISPKIEFILYTIIAFLSILVRKKKSSYELLFH